MNSKNITALLLCGGKGERLKPLTTTVPKPLIPIKERPILSYILEHLESYGVNEFVIATGYKAEQIEEFIVTSCEGKKIRTINSGDVDIIQRIRDAAKQIDSDFLLLYGDTLSDVNIDKLIEFHQAHPGKATVTLWPLRSQFGVMEVGSNGVVCDYLEKPVLDKWINIGYFYLSKEIVSDIESFKKFEDFLLHIIENRELNGFKHEGVHITVNTQKELTEAEKNISRLSKNL